LSFFSSFFVLVLKARIQNLENDVKKIKDSIQVALDKSNNDDQLIEALRNEITRLQQKITKMAEETSRIERTGGGKKGNTMTSKDDVTTLKSSLKQQEEWVQKEQHYQSELLRLQRLCRNQVTCVCCLLFF
jgi:chromosome segregation ATPase